MEFTEYQYKAMFTKGKHESKQDAVMEGVLGLIGESGELIDHFKKWIYHGHKLDINYVSTEMGDILWYLALLADTLGLELRDIARDNILKLAKRYPNGFNPYDSINREV